MLRFASRQLPRLLPRPLPSFVFSASSGGKEGQVPVVPQKKLPRQKNIFLNSVYGIEVKKHVFPSGEKKFQLSQEQMKFYQRNSPNYVVALVRKVIDGADFPEEAKAENSQTINQFYNVCTYCRIYYGKGFAKLVGLYRTRIISIEKLDLQSAQPATQGGYEPQFILEGGQEQEDTGLDIRDLQKQTIESNEFSIADMINVQRRKRMTKNQTAFYSVKLQKLQELPLVITPRLQMKLKYLIEIYVKMNQSINQGKTSNLILNIIDMGKILDTIAAECSDWIVNKQGVQGCLEALDRQERIDKVQKLIVNTRYYKSYLSDIEKAAQNNLRSKKIQEYYTEMLKIGKQLLDGKKAKQIFLEKITKSFYSNEPTEQIKEVFEAEKEKYDQLDENSHQSGVIKIYIEELSKIPYGIKTEQVYDLEGARKILQQEHYGMEDAKAAILQIIAVGKLKKTLKGKIFCFIGGPGVGKTTFARSIAKALNRKFYNISLGGVTDSSALKGHRRTYVGAYSGKIIEALKSCGSNNPVILLDQIDKMGNSYQGDPRSQLLQILDPNQNNSFVDNFVDVPVDLSNVLFICSANYQQNISKPLLDRMEKIKLTSYTNHQKKQIFKRHLLRRSIGNTGVSDEQFDLDESAVNAMIEDYSIDQPGVRYLEKFISLIMEKVAYQVVTQQPLPIKIDKTNISRFIGNSHRRERDHHKIQKGVAISLGGGRYGGRLTYIQAFKKSFLNNKKDRKRELMFTGSLGDVFKEAMNISYTYARNFLAHELKNKYLYENEVHLHAPEGASKKDGSTDSITIAAALVSLALNKEVKKGVALTGELTLHGKVLRTHGIKEKMLVAKRQKIKEVVVSFQNFAEVENLKEDVKQGLTFHFVKQFPEVYKILFS